MSCGCNNGCFIHDYYCSCLTMFHPQCFTFNSAFFVAEKTCHAGSTCVTIKSVHNFNVKKMDGIWGLGIRMLKC